MSSPTLQESDARRSHAQVADGLAALHAGRPAEAILHFEQALKWHNADPDAYYYLARALLDIGETKVARDTLDLARERLPTIFGEDGAFGVYPPLAIATDAQTGTTLVKQSRILELADETVLSSRAKLEQAIRLLDTGAAAEAVPILLSALEVNPWNVSAYYYLAQAFANAGDMEKAERVLAKAIDDFPFAYKRASQFGAYQGLALEPKTTIAYYNVLARSYPDIVRFLAPPRSTAATGASSLLRTYREAADRWQDGKLPAPALATTFATAGPDSAAELRNTKRVLLVIPRWIKCNPAWDDYEIAFHLDGAARQSLAHYELHHGDAIHTEAHHLAEPRSDAELTQGVRALHDHIERFRPDCVVMEGSFVGGIQCISRDQIRNLKDAFGFRLATLIIDCNPPLPNYAAYWGAVSDLIVSMNEDPYLDEARRQCRVIVCPGTPIDLSLMESAWARVRDIGVLYVGARKRYRDLWAAHLMESGVPFHLRFTIQSHEHSVSAQEFIELHGRAHVVLNNGLISSRESATNFRIFEAITAGAVLLQQDFDGLHEYLVPHVHYAPFNNIHEMIAAARLLLDHDDVRTRIADAALSWYRANFGGTRFWGKVLEEVFR